MKRPWEVLAAGYVLGELAAGAGISVPAAAVMLTVCFALCFCGEDGGACRAGSAAPGAERRKAASAAALLLLPAFLCGLFRMTLEMRPMPEDRTRPAEEERTSLRIDAMEEKNGQLVLTCGDMLLYVPAETYGAKELQIGNRIEARGKCSAFPAATNPGQFDTAAFYRAKGIRRRMYVKDLRVTDARCDPVRQLLHRIRNHCISLLYRGCEADDAAFLSAVLFGDRSGLDEDFRKLYQRNGIAHLLAISGLHVSILGLGLYHSLRKNGQSYAVSGIISGIFLILYGLLTGAGISVSRAVLMLLLLFLAEWEGRTYDLRTAACIAAIVQLFLHPFALYQCGFQLSFLAVLAIGGPADTLIRGFEIRNGILRSLIVSLSVTLCTLPVIAWWFFAVPVFAPVLNLLVIPLMGWILGAGLIVLFIAVLCFGVFPGVSVTMAAGSGSLTSGTAGLPSDILYFCLRTAEGVVHRLLQVNGLLCRLTERIPMSRILTGRPHLPQVLCYILLLCGSYACILRILGIRRTRKEAERKEEETKIVVREVRPGNCGGKSGSCGSRGSRGSWPGNCGSRVLEKIRQLSGEPEAPAVSAAVLLLAALLSLAPYRPRNPEIWFLDVGQGDGIAVLYRDSCVLIDGGSSSERDPGKKILEPFLESRAVSRIETVFLTHADQDHVNGIEYLLSDAETPEIGRVVLNAAAETDPAYDELKKEIRAGGADLQYLGAGEEMGFFRCLWPVPGQRDPDLNEQSLVLLFSSGENRVLFTGDAGKASEPGILRELYGAGGGEAPGAVSILKAGHHGSSTSSGEAFLQAIRPEYTVISCGRNNRYGHPHRETVEALEEAGTSIFSTAVCGAVCAETDGERVKLIPYLRLPPETRKY